MQLVKFSHGTLPEAVGLLQGSDVIPLQLRPPYTSLSDILNADDPGGVAQQLSASDRGRLPLSSVKLLAPIDRQEVWAAGVTYRRSKVARMEESKGAAVFYDMVYEAARPELFFKANPHRVVGPGQPVRIRQDARWNVPEPELALVLNSRLKLVGFTIGNDMSSRDIEGENPLYLPQAKVYDGCCALGPAITLAGSMPPIEQIGIHLVVRRAGRAAFEGRTNADQLARTFEELIGWLGRDNSFPNGAFLLTGTGIVPSEEFTLQPADEVEITIDGIGTLRNPVEQSRKSEVGSRKADS